MAADKNRPRFEALLDVSRVCIAPDAPWDERNDRLVEAILLSNSQPKPAYEQIFELLAKGININARHPEGYTALALAKYNECSPSVIATLTYAGNKGGASVQAAKAPEMPIDPASVIHALPIQFRGTASEYFRIWAVNLCLTLLTLGIFSAWAKVRKKRYFYSHTTLDDTPFQYLGQPIPILKGRIVAAVLFLLYYASSNFFTVLLPYVLAAGLVLAPWVIVRSAAFNARYSAFRNMTFHFDAKYRDALKVIYWLGLIPVLVVGGMFSWWGNLAAAGVAYAVFGFAFPWWLRGFKNFLVGHTVFGGANGKLSVTGGQFFKIYFLAGLIIGGISLVTGIVVAATFAAMKVKMSPFTFVLLSLPIYAGYVLAFAYIQAHSSNLVWNRTQLGPLRFQSTLSGRGLAKLYLTNALAIVASAGLLTPWAVMRTLKYRADNMRVLLDGALTDFRGSEATAVQAAGAELGEFFDVDLSL